MTHRSFDIALVGCGRISKNHFDAIAQTDGLRLVGVADVDAARARAAGEERGVPWFTSLEELLRAQPCDMVALCTPSGVH
ncbi:MAG: Gfo/Idh/MocA family oxidoreductase, partial [Gemmatimonadaceae bacterium]